MPIEDFSVPTLEGLNQAFAALRQAEIEGMPTLVHCVPGMGRTGIVLAGWVRARYGLGVEEAIAEDGLRRSTMPAAPVTPAGTSRWRQRRW